MPAPSPSWQLIDLTAKWFNVGDGTLKAGTYKVTVPVEIVNQTDQVKIPAGVFKSGALNITTGSPSLSIQVPCTNDPDNDPQPDWKLTVAVTFTDGSAPETYSVYAPYADRPTADGGTGDGVNLIDFVQSAVVPQANPAYKIGVAGGLAELNASGLVVNADGSTPSGGGSGTVTSVAGVSPTSGDVVAASLKSALALNLVNNTADTNKNVASAAKLTTGRQIALTGPVTGAVTFDGTADVTITTTLTGGTLGESLLADESQADAWADLGIVPDANLRAPATFKPANLAGRLALAAKQGDTAVQVDTGVSYRLATTDPTVDANWTALTSPAPVAATTTTAGVVALATTSQATTGTDTTHAVTPAGLQAGLNTIPPDRVMYGSGWPGTRPADGGRPLQWDDTANAITVGEDTTPPPVDVVQDGDYWWTIVYV